MAAHDAGHRHDHAGHAHHHHAPAPESFDRAFAIGIALNLGFVAVEAGYGALADSLGLLADAGHNFSDVFALVLAWAGSFLGRRRPSARFTYGLGSSSILVALLNAIVLLLAVGAISWEAVRRFAAPPPVAGVTVIVVAAVGIVVNGASAWLFASGSKHDINLKGAFLHLAADALVSAGVVVAGILILATGWLWIDPAVSLVIAVVIVWSTWGLLRDAIAMSLAAVPPGIDAAAIRDYLEVLPGVERIHDLHIWPMSTTETALTCHLVMPAPPADDAFMTEVARVLHRRFKVGHVTIQVERGDAACALEPDHVV
jgi:cobalt-zinc-cadmium efflux system protein